MGLGDCNISLLAAVLLLPDTDFLSQLLLRLESEILEANEFAFVLFTFELNLEFLFWFNSIFLELSSAGGAAAAAADDVLSLCFARLALCMFAVRCGSILIYSVIYSILICLCLFFSRQNTWCHRQSSSRVNFFDFSLSLGGPLHVQLCAEAARHSPTEDIILQCCSPFAL